MTAKKIGKRAQILAGGTDLLVQMRSVDNAPRTIIDVKSLEETNRLDIGDEIYIDPRYRALSFTKTKS